MIFNKYVLSLQIVRSTLQIDESENITFWSYRECLG